MRKTQATTAARMRCHADQAIVELWSRNQGWPSPAPRRAPRNWIFRSVLGETTEETHDRQILLEGRGFRWEGAIEPELKVPTPIPRDMNVEELLVHFEPAMTRAQFGVAVRRLEEVLEEKISRDCQEARALIEKIHLIAGNRRTQVVEVAFERRAEL